MYFCTVTNNKQQTTNENGKRENRKNHQVQQLAPILHLRRIRDHCLHGTPLNDGRDAAQCYLPAKIQNVYGIGKTKRGGKVVFMEKSNIKKREAVNISSFAYCILMNSSYLCGHEKRSL